MRDEQAAGVFVTLIISVIIMMITLVFVLFVNTSHQNSIVKGKPMLYGDKVYMCGEVVLE